MPNNSQDRRKLLVDYISANASDNMLEQFFKISKLITDYSTLESKDVNPEAIEKNEFETRLNFVNETYNCMNVINKIIALSVDKRKKPSITVHNSDDNKTAISETRKEVETVTSGYVNTEDGDAKSKVDDIVKNSITTATSTTDDYVTYTKPERKKKKATKTTIKNMLEKDMESWGINKTSYTYKLIMAMADIKLTKDMRPQDIINAAAEKLGSKPNVASSALAGAVKKIDPRTSLHCISLLNIDGEFTKEVLVNAIYNDILLK